VIGESECAADCPRRSALPSLRSLLCCSCRPVAVLVSNAYCRILVWYSRSVEVLTGSRRGGQYRRTRLFVLTLGYSRKAVRLLVFRSSTRIWAELHEKAFRRLGGAPRILVLDNLREGVLVPDIYDATLNPSIATCSPITVRSPYPAGSRILLGSFSFFPPCLSRWPHCPALKPSPLSPTSARRALWEPNVEVEPFFPSPHPTRQRAAGVSWRAGKNGSTCKLPR